MNSNAPEWVTVKGAVSRFSISRARLYELIAEGAIKSKSLRRPGNVRGRRLISFDSLAAYVEGFDDALIPTVKRKI